MTYYGKPLVFVMLFSFSVPDPPFPAPSPTGTAITFCNRMYGKINFVHLGRQLSGILLLLKISAIIRWVVTVVVRIIVLLFDRSQSQSTMDGRL